VKQVFNLFITAILISLSGVVSSQTIWTGDDYTFTKPDSADWTLPANQDEITPSIILTRQNYRPLYNYQWFQTNFNADASNGDLMFNFWNDSFGEPVTHTFTATGGPKGLKWAILDSTGSTSDWSSFTLGDSTNFYSFHAVASIIYALESGDTVTSVDDYFNINGETGGSGTNMQDLIGKSLGVWIVEEDIYFTLTLNTWSSQGRGGVSYTRSTEQVVNNTEEVIEANSIQLFPNPSNEFIQLSGLTKIEQYQIFNLTGAEITSGTIANQEAISIQNLQEGLYFLKLESGATIKFLKQ